MLSGTAVRNLKGEQGGLYITDTALHSQPTGRAWDAIFAHSAVVIAVAVSPNIAGTLTSVALPAGAVWYGRFTAITLTSGQVTAYNAI